MHSGYPKIIHRDIKAANILLDDKFEAMVTTFIYLSLYTIITTVTKWLTAQCVTFAQVADFGLAKLSSDKYTHVSTRVMGTFG